MTESLLSIQALSLLLLLLGIGLAFSDIRLSSWVLGWALLAGALLLQGFRSVLTYFFEHGGVDPATYAVANDWMAQIVTEHSIAGVSIDGQWHTICIVRDITERKQFEDRIRHLANYDSLTGLPNRMLFYDRLRQAINLAERNRHELSLLYLDLDKFKAVNDSLGHDAGDEILKGAADRIQQQVRESDTVARIGGDEFAVILPEIASQQDAATVARKIIDAMLAVFELNGGKRENVHIGASIGIATFPTDGPDMDALLKVADAAMYKAKQSGSSFSFSTDRKPDPLQ